MDFEFSEDQLSLRRPHPRWVPGANRVVELLGKVTAKL